MNLLQNVVNKPISNTVFKIPSYQFHNKDYYQQFSKMLDLNPKPHI